MTRPLRWTRTHSGRWQSWFKAPNAGGLRTLIATPTRLVVLSCGMASTKRLHEYPADGVNAAKVRAKRLRGEAI